MKKILTLGSCVRLSLKPFVTLSGGIVGFRATLAGISRDFSLGGGVAVFGGVDDDAGAEPILSIFFDLDYIF